MKNIILIITISFLCFSCNQKKQKADFPIINIDLNDANNTPVFQNIPKSIEKITLETNTNSLIGGVDQFCKDDSILFLLDCSQDELFLFSTTGKLLSQIQKKGKGPGEFVDATTFGINKKDDIIYLYDIEQRKLLKFNYTGDFIEEIYGDNQTNFYRNICILNNGNLLMANPDLCDPVLDGVWESDINGKYLRRHSDVKKHHSFSWMVFPYFSQFNNTISYYNSFTDQIYSLRSKEIHCVTQFNLKQKLPERFLSNPDGTGEGTGPYYLNSGMAETEKYYFLEYFSNRNGKVFVLVNKESQKVEISNNLFENRQTWKYSSTGLFNYDNDAFMWVDFMEKENTNPDLKIIRLK